MVFLIGSSPKVSKWRRLKDAVGMSDLGKDRGEARFNGRRGEGGRCVSEGFDVELEIERVKSSQIKCVEDGGGEFPWLDSAEKSGHAAQAKWGVDTRSETVTGRKALNPGRQIWVS